MCEKTRLGNCWCCLHFYDLGSSSRALFKAALLSGMVVAVTHAAAVYIEELFHAVDYGWSTIELLQKTQKKTSQV